MVEARTSAVRSRSVSSLRRDGRTLAIATEVLTRRLLRQGARYGEREPARLEVGV